MKPSEKRALKEQKLKEKEEKAKNIDIGDDTVVNEKSRTKSFFTMMQREAGKKDFSKAM